MLTSSFILRQSYFSAKSRHAYIDAISYQLAAIELTPTLATPLVDATGSIKLAVIYLSRHYEPLTAPAAYHAPKPFIGRDAFHALFTRVAMLDSFCVLFLLLACITCRATALMAD